MSGEKDPAKLPTEVLQKEVERCSLALTQKGFLPNGLQQLVFGSMAYRPKSLFFDTGANQGIHKDNKEFDRLWREWIEKYDPFTGENLAGTASYQHERYSPQDTRFPKPETDQYRQLVEQMRELGSFVRALNEKMGWEKTTEILTHIDTLKRKINTSSKNLLNIFLILSQNDHDL